MKTGGREEGSPKASPSIAIVSSGGDPRDPRVWSGTPNNIVCALEGLGCRVTTVNLRPPRALRGALKVLCLATGHGPEYHRTWISSLMSGVRLSPQLGQGLSTCLHMGTASVPIGARSSGIRHAIYLDSTFHLMSEQSLNCYSKAVRQKYDRFERRALLAVDHIFTVSQHVRQDVLDYYGVPAERTTAVGTGRGKIHAVDGPKDYSDCMTLFVAKERFEEKGGSLLLAGFRLAVQSDPRLKLVVVAQEQYREVVESIPGAEFKTALPWHELEAIFNRASLFAMPARYEPWGLVYIEALACRTPIMGLNRNALPELARNGDAGFLLDVATPDAVAKCLLDAFSNTERLAEMGRAGQEHAQKSYSWDKTAASIYSALFGSFASTKQPMSHDATKQRAEY